MAKAKQMDQKTLILDNKAVHQKLNRIAYQILEDTYKEQEVYFLGLQENGHTIASIITDIIGDQKQCHLIPFTIDKKNPVKGDIQMNLNLEDLNDKTVIICDDVANTGRILSYAIKPLLSVYPKKIRVMVLVDRKHKKYPVSADFVGLSLATTMQEHITVEFDNNHQAKVYLD